MHTEVLSFALQIRSGRTLLGWSQAELAEKAGVARPTVARIESLQMLPRLDTAGKLKQALRVGGVIFHDDNDSVGFTVGLSGEFIEKLGAELQAKNKQ